MNTTHIENNFMNKDTNQQGRVGYLVLWLLGAPVSVLLLLWVILGNNLIGPG